MARLDGSGLSYDSRLIQKVIAGANGAIGWGGWTRTNTVLINSEVSYQLDHAPTGHLILAAPRQKPKLRLTSYLNIVPPPMVVKPKIGRVK